MSAPKRVKTEPVDEPPKVKYSAKPFSAQSSRSDAAALTEAEALEQLINLLKEAGKDGLSQETVMQRLGQRNIAVISEALNQLSKSNRVVFLGAAGDKQGEFWGYRYVTDEESTKLSGLSEDERGVYNLVEREGNRGIWFRDLKRRTPIEHARLTKLLKTLVARKLIKQENSVQGKNRKVYMLFDLEPAREVTGGAFHSGHELDLEFVEQLSKVALVYLKKFTLATTYEILEYIKSVGLSNVALSLEDTQTVLSTLVYDGQVELVPPARVPLLWQNRISKEQEMAASKAAVGAKRTAALISEPELTEEDLLEDYYRIAPAPAGKDPYTEIPCATCPVARECNAHSEVNPVTCKYLHAWLQF